jgi:hypothetical protein
LANEIPSLCLGNFALASAVLISLDTKTTERLACTGRVATHGNNLGKATQDSIRCSFVSALSGLGSPDQGNPTFISVLLQLYMAVLSFRFSHASSHLDESQLGISNFEYLSNDLDEDFASNEGRME